jgi:hypothetical protein
MNKMVWMIDGITPLQSKGGTGNGKMVSGTKRRMHSFGGPKFSADELMNINKKREGQSYCGFAEESEESTRVCSQEATYRVTVRMDARQWGRKRWLLECQSHAAPSR